SALAETYMRLGQESEAQAERSRAEAAPPSDAAWPDPFVREADKLRTGLEARLEDANEMFSAGHLDLAIAELRKLVREYPASDTAWIALGTMLSRTNQLADAESVLRQALTLNPHRAEVLLLLADVLLARDDY